MTSRFQDMTMKTRFSLLLAAAFAVSCGQPALIDRTQPNYLKKADLDGVWYIKETVVDAPNTPGAASFVGRGGKMEKIRWEIQEDKVVAYRAYEVVPGADPRVDRDASKIGHVVFKDGRPYVGNPVFAYKISSHFDRQRQYNAATGEQSNVLTEDSSDRPWYQREFMRVDWKSNLISNTQSECATPVHHGSCFDGDGLLLRYVTERDDQPEDQAQVFTRDAAGKLTYFDWTTQAIIDPPSVYYEGYGMLPYCLFNPTIDCESSDVRVRTSVRKVDEAHVADYEPLAYSDKLMVKFGYFRQESFSYSPDYYYTYSGRQFFAMRHNIWARSHDEQGKTIPVAERPLKPIVYYMTANTPSHILPVASKYLAQKGGWDPEQTIEASWDHAFRRAVAVPRGLDAKAVPQMFYVCSAPVKEGDPAACGEPGLYPRLGDLRYNLVPYVDQQVGGLLGMGPSAMDPETGEVIQAVANIYGATLDTWAGSSQQIMDVVNGDVSISQLVAGKDIKDYVFANLNPTDPRRPATGPWTSQQPLTSEPNRTMGSFGAVDGRLKTLTDTWKQAGQLPLARENRKETVARLLAQNPALEGELLNLPEIRLAAQSLTSNEGFRAKLSTNTDFYRQVARNIVFGTDPAQLAREAAKKAIDPSIGCYYEVNYDDEDYVGVAQAKLRQQQQLVAKFKSQGNTACAAKNSCTDAEALTLAKGEIYNVLRREAFRSVTEHEIGHTLGLRHNFTGSADPLNYKDGYWDLRKDTIGVQVGGRRVLPITPQNLLDASKPNERQLENGMYEYQYSSIMDYGARVTAQNKGVGKYDDAAILFAYAGGYEPGWVEVFNEVRRDYSSPNITVPVDNAAKVFTARGAQVEMPLAFAEHYTGASNFYTDKYHYSTLPFHFADQQSSFEGMVDQGISRMNNRSFRKWSEMEGHYRALASSLKTFNLSSGGLQETDYVKAQNVVNAAHHETIEGQAFKAEPAAAAETCPSSTLAGPCVVAGTSWRFRVGATATAQVEAFVAGTYTITAFVHERLAAGDATHATFDFIVDGRVNSFEMKPENHPNRDLTASGGYALQLRLSKGKHEVGVRFTNPNAEKTRTLFVDRADTAVVRFDSGEDHIPVEVPFMFCTDQEVGANLMCNLHDQGADVFEMTSKWIERFNQTYVFSNFRRDRLSYSPASVASGKFSRYLGNIPNVYQQWLFNIYYLARYYQLSPEQIDKYYGLGDPIWQNYWTMAVTDSTNLLMQQLSIPSAGYHGKKADGTWEYVPTGDPQNRRLEGTAETKLIDDLRKPANGAYTDVLYIPRGPGRSMFSVYDTFGYDNFTRVNEAGHFWDVFAAMLALTTSETNFLGVDRGSDALRYSLPYYMTFNLELAPLFNNFWTENQLYYAPSIAKQTDGTGVVQLPVFLRAQDYVQGFVYPPPSATPLDNAGNTMVMAKATTVAPWSARFYAQVWSMAYFTANFNQEFATFNQVFRLGAGDNLTPAAGFSVVTYADPFGGGYTYAALKKDGAVNPPAGAAMVERAAQFRTKWELAKSSNQPVDGYTASQWETKARDATRTLEMMRGLYDIFGRAW